MSLLAASSNYAAVIRPLQVLVMVVALLFFARVLRVAVVEARPADQESGRSRRKRSAPLALEFIEPDEMAGQRIDVDLAVVIGRGADCDISLADTYLSTRHARIANDSGDLSIEDLGSTNGTYVNQELLRGRVLLERGDMIQVGGVLLEVVR